MYTIYDLDWTTPETYKHIIDESESIMVMPVMLNFSVSKMGTLRKSPSKYFNSIDPKSQITILSRTLEQIPFFEPNPLQSDPHNFAKCTILTQIRSNLYLVEGRTTTNHINHEPPGFSVFFCQVA